jgi:two-component SAPR family response regulator
MPGMTGVELAAASRELRPSLPILLATGYAELPEGAKLDLPRLAKPYHQDQLRDRLDQLLGSEIANWPAQGEHAQRRQFFGR